MKRIAIASDHGGYDQKQSLIPFITAMGFSVKDLGPENTASVDYPDYAHMVSKLVSRGEADFGILVCGTGLGMAIAANKVAGVRAVPVQTTQFAHLAREHNDANVLCLSGRFADDAINKAIVKTFLETEFAKGRHERRVAKLESD